MTQQMAIDFTPAPAPYQRHSRTSRAVWRVYVFAKLHCWQVSVTSTVPPWS